MLGGEGDGGVEGTKRGVGPGGVKMKSTSLSALVQRLITGDVSASVSIREAIQGRGPSVQNLMAANGIPALCDTLKNRRLPQRKKLLDSLLSTIGDCSLDSGFRNCVCCFL